MILSSNSIRSLAQSESLGLRGRKSEAPRWHAAKHRVCVSLGQNRCGKSIAWGKASAYQTLLYVLQDAIARKTAGNIPSRLVLSKHVDQEHDEDVRRPDD